MYCFVFEIKRLYDLVNVCQELNNELNNELYNELYNEPVLTVCGVQLLGRAGLQGYGQVLQGPGAVWGVGVL